MFLTVGIIFHSFHWPGLFSFYCPFCHCPGPHFSDCPFLTVGVLSHFSHCPGFFFPFSLPFSDCPFLTVRVLFSLFSLSRFFLLSHCPFLTAWTLPRLSCCPFLTSLCPLLIVWVYSNFSSCPFLSAWSLLCLFLIHVFSSTPEYMYGSYCLVCSEELRYWGFT